MNERDLLAYGGPMLILVAELCEMDLADVRETSVKLDGLRALCNEVQARAEQYADGWAEHPRECCPPVEIVGR